MGQDYLYISKILVEWYNQNKRELPWRDTKNAYHIWISEIILQQTRVVQGYDYYVRFLERFPNVNELALADEEDVLKMWQGLGYYSRARNLHIAAKSVVEEYRGEFPKSYDQIISLKGIGEYTAAAIASFAFDLPHAVVDGNVYRVLSRLFAISTPIDSTAGKKEFRELAGQLLDVKNPGLHNQAIMEFGALQCVPASPNCTACPLSSICLSFIENKVSNYPVKQGKVKVKTRFFYYFDIRCGNSLYLNKREADDIWKNLYELPLIEVDEDMNFNNLQHNPLFRQLFGDAAEFEFYSTPIALKHILSHRVIIATFYRVRVQSDESLRTKYKKIDIADLEQYPISRLVDKYFKLIGQSN